MTIIQSILLGLIEGLTEYIPVSSTAHLLIAQRLLALPSDNAMFAFLVLVQLGPLAALLVYFWKDYWRLMVAFFARPLSTPDNRQAWYIILATIPAGLAGVLLKDVVQNLFGQPLLEAAIRMFTAAVLLSLGEWLGKKNRNLDFAHLAGRPGGGSVPGPGRLSWVVALGLHHPGRHAPQLRPALGHALRFPDRRADHAGGGRL